MPEDRIAIEWVHQERRHEEGRPRTVLWRGWPILTILDGSRRDQLTYQDQVEEKRSGTAIPDTQAIGTPRKPWFVAICNLGLHPDSSLQQYSR